MIKRIIKSLVLSLTVFILIPGAVTLAAYTTSLLVQNTTATDYDMLGTNTTANVDYWAANGFCDDDGLDIEIYKGTAQLPHMLASDRITCALPINGYSSQTLSLTTGNTPATDTYIIPTYADNTSVGYIQIDDADNIELHDNDWNLTFSKLFLDTDNASGKNLWNKPNALEIFTSPTVTENITAETNNADFADTFDTDKWIDVGDKILVNTANSRLDYDALRADGDDRTYHNLGENVSDTVWRLDYEWTPTAQAVADDNVFAFGLWSDNANVDSYTGDAIVMFLLSSGAGNTLAYARSYDGGASNQTPAIAFTYATTYYVTLERIAADNMSLSLYSDASRTTHVAGSPVTYAIQSTVGGLHYLQASNFASGADVGREQGYIDELFLYSNYNGSIVGDIGTVLDVTNAEYDTFEVEVGDRPDTDNWSSIDTIGMSFGTGILPGIVIDTITTTAPVASVTFEDILTKVANIDDALGVTSRHLAVYVNAHYDAAVFTQHLRGYINSDTGNNYNNQQLYGSAAVPTASRDTGIAYAYYGNCIAGNSIDNNAFTGGTILYPAAFLTSNHKTYIANMGGAEISVWTINGRWADTDAIDSLTYHLSSGNFATGSTFQLCVVDERYLVEEDYDASADFLPVFDGIAGTGDNLVMIASTRTDRVLTQDSINHEINNDAVAANYNRQYVQGANAVVAANSSVGQYIGETTGNTATANAFAPIVVFYSEYAETSNYTSYLTLAGFHEGTPSALAHIFSGRWSNTTAITKLEYTPVAGTNFKANSIFSLYRVPQHLIYREELFTNEPEIVINLSDHQEYEAWQIHIHGRTDTAAASESVNMTLNNDTTDANYDTQILNGAGAVVSAARNAASRTVLDVTAATEGANEFGGGIITIFNGSAADRNKHYIVIDGLNENSINIRSIRWESNSAIVSVNLTPAAGGNFVQGTIVEVVGIIPTRTFSMSIDDELRSIADANGLVIPYNDDVISAMAYNSMIYADSVNLTISGAEQIYYDPNDILVSTGTTATLPDRGSDGTANDGTIYWGSNPTGVELTLGAFESDYDVPEIPVTQNQDIAPEIITPTISVADAAKLASLAAKDPLLYPIFKGFHDSIAGDLPILLMYEIAFFALAVGAFAYLMKFGHLTIGVFAVWAIIGFAVAWGIYDWWVIAIIILIGLGFILMQGRQSP